MANCKQCGKETDHLYTYVEHDGLCWKCMKMMQLEDERDWEDDPECESEVDDNEDESM